MKMSANFRVFAFLVLTFALGLSIFYATNPELSGEAELASREPAQVPTRTFAIGAYLPENPQQKVYLVINGRNIQAIGPQRPGNMAVFETDSLVFPGLMDMHNHVKYNILPLWGLSKGQFINRFEWRKKFAPYKDAVSMNMQPIKGDTVCAAVRWAEVKSLSGGGTSMQGIGTDTKCATAFGVMNVEVPGDLSPGKIRASTDLWEPPLLGRVFIPSIAPQMKRGTVNFSSNADAAQRQAYDVALMNTLAQTGILAWLDQFANQPRSIQLGIKLMIDMDIPPQNDMSPATFNRLIPQIQARLAQVNKLKPNEIEKQIRNMQIWLYGPDGRSGYLSLKRPNQPLKDFALIDDSPTMNYFGKAGVISVDPKVRRYLAMFETASRRSVLGYLDLQDRLAVIAHIAEGRRTDPYNHMEYTFAQDLGFARPGLVMIHAVGLDANQLADAARRKLSIVWSPFSNLLLYGETLDVVTAKRAGVNIAMGPDWSPTGSKNMLDELKIARRYLNKMRVPANVISDRDLVDMATINGARAVGLDRTLGRVAPGYTANLLFVDRKLLQQAKDPWTALISATQKDVDLVVIGGEPLYGDLQLVQNVSREFRDASAPETLPRNQQKCDFKKGLRMPWYSKYDQEAQAKGLNFRTVAGLEAELRGKMEAHAQEIRAKDPRRANSVAWLDPIYTCEDDYYAREFGQFIEKTLDANQAGRAQLRAQYRLNDKWTPLGDSDDDDGDDNDNN